MSLREEISEMLEVLEGEMAVASLTYASVTYPCSASTEKRGTVIVVGGEQVEIQMTLFVRRTAMATAPRTGRTLTYNALSYRILEVGTPQPGSHWEIDVGDVNGG